MPDSVFAVDQRGQLVGVRRKITPTLGERLVHAPGSGDSVRIFESDWGPVSALICGENSNPLLGFSMQALGAVVHVACWPSHFTPAPMMQDIIPLTTRAFAYQAGVFVVNAVGGISDEMLELLPLTDEDHEFLQRSIKLGGGASIIAPGGTYLAGPMGEGEGIVYADADLEAVVRRKIVQDYAGHYNRPDIFTLQVNGERRGMLEFR